MDAQIKKLALEIISHNKKFILGIVGMPGAGKSTIANKLANSINNISNREVAIALPMDGFHLHNDILNERGLYPIKGTPQTFDGESFISLLKKVKNYNENIGWPDFDRKVGNPRADMITIKPSHKYIIVEGNYLLLDEEPWIQTKYLLDECWYLEHPWDEELYNRLLKRHMLGGRTKEQAKDKILCTDYPNALLIERTKTYADKIIRCPDSSKGEH